MNPIPTDRQSEGMAAFVTSVFPGFDFHARYPAAVVGTGGPDTIDVAPDDPRIPGMAGIELDLGLPGCKVTVSGGTRCLVGWKGGDPSMPFVDLWQAGGVVTELDIAAAIVKLGSNPGSMTALINGVVMAKGIDPFTGATYGALGNASTSVEVSV